MTPSSSQSIRLTQYSHGAGCGCKIAPDVLQKMLTPAKVQASDANLLVGNENFDDAAVYRLNDEQSIISTTDFFTPIVDDPFDFGSIAAVNALSDVYAMGGSPMMAVSILGWPVDKIAASVAARVLDGARAICAEAGIVLAGGHSIDSPEPIFGLAVTGKVNTKNIKRNNTATVGCDLYLTKQLGVGILTTAQKMGVLELQDLNRVTRLMKTLNKAGAELGERQEVKAMTDVTGFGLLGHLIEMCEGSGVSAEIHYTRLPLLANLNNYIQKKTFPGGIFRNYSSYGARVSGLDEEKKRVLCDPQTSGGLLLAIDRQKGRYFEQVLHVHGIEARPMGRIIPQKDYAVYIK